MFCVSLLFQIEWQRSTKCRLTCSDRTSVSSFCCSKSSFAISRSCFRFWASCFRFFLSINFLWRLACCRCFSMSIFSIISSTSCWWVARSYVKKWPTWEPKWRLFSIWHSAKKGLVKRQHSRDWFRYPAGFLIGLFTWCTSSGDISLDLAASSAACLSFNSLSRLPFSASSSSKAWSSSAANSRSSFSFNLWVSSSCRLRMSAKVRSCSLRNACNWQMHIQVVTRMHGAFLGKVSPPSFHSFPAT